MIKIQKLFSSFDKKKDKSRAQWTTFALSFLIVLILVGLLFYQFTAMEDSAPIISVTPDLENVRQIEGQFYLPLEIKNAGGSTAEAVRIRTNLTRENRIDEVPELIVQYLSGGETVKGEVVLHTDPAVGTLSYDISYLLP